MPPGDGKGFRGASAGMAHPRLAFVSVFSGLAVNSSTNKVYFADLEGYVAVPDGATNTLAYLFDPNAPG